MYTDGSKDPESGRVAIGLAVPQLKISKGCRVSDHTSVFTAEMVTVLWALRWVEDNKPNYSVTCSDSAATLKTIKRRQSKSRPDLLTEICLILYGINKTGCEVGFIWVPAHMGVEGKEEADCVAALSFNAGNTHLSGGEAV